MRTILIAVAVATGACGSGVPTSSDVKLQNATAHVKSRFICMNPTGSCNTYELNFVVVNGANRAVDRVDNVLVSTGGAPLSTATAVTCNGPPWTLAPGGQSGVVNLDVTLGVQAYLRIDCEPPPGASNAATPETTLVGAPYAPSSSFDLRIQGLLSDAQPFEATAHATLIE